MDTVGAGAGYNSSFGDVPSIDNYNSVMPTGHLNTDGKESGADVRTYCIPLACLSSLFRSYDKLLPSHLMSGCRFELELEASKVAFKSVAGATAPSIGYTVDDIELHCDAYTLTDSVTRVLNETAATSGLEIPFVTYSHVEDAVSQGSNNWEIRKAVSRSLSVITKLSVQETVAGEETKDSMRSVEHNIESFQCRVGSLYFPNNPVSGDSADRTLSSMYFHAMHAFVKPKTPSAPSGVTLGEYKSHLGAIVTTLERSSALLLTGVPVNASRVCEVRARVKDANAANLTADSWLSYVRLIRVFINQVEVEE